MTMNEHDFHWTCDRRTLKLALDRLKKTFDARSTIPLLFQLEVTPDPFHGGAMLRVTDLEAHHSVPVPGVCSGDMLMVDFLQLLKIVNALPEGQIEIRGDAPAPVEYHEVERAKQDASTGWKKVPYMVTEAKPRPAQLVRGMLGKKTFQLFRWDHTAEGDTLPETPVCPPGFPCTTVKLDLASLLAPVLHAVATDDSRYGLNGVQLEIYPDGSAGAVSTDGHRAVVHHTHLAIDGNPSGPLLPRGWCATLKDIAPGPVKLTWWKPLACGGSLSGLATMDTSRFVEGAPLYRVHFDLGGDGKASRTVIRESGKISVVPEVRPDKETCTVQTNSEILALLLSSHISLDDWLELPDVSVSGDAPHLRALYEEAPRSDVVRVDHPDGTVLTTRCLEGDFPDWRQVVPKRFLREVVADRKVLDEAVKYVMTVASTKTHCVRVSLQNGSILLGASNPDEGELSDEVPAETRGRLTSLTDEEFEQINLSLSQKGKPLLEHTPFRIGLDGQYLRDELKILDGDRVELRFGDSLNPVILRRPGDDSLLCLVMPMRIE